MKAKDKVLKMVVKLIDDRLESLREQLKNASKEEKDLFEITIFYELERLKDALFW